MRKILLLFLFFILQYGICCAQNLVFNPSFELYDTCPPQEAYINYALGWSAYSVSPDYFNICNTNGIVGVPKNYIGYQNAASGVAYAGIGTFAVGQQVREYLGSQLINTLIIGKKYFVSMKVSLGEYGTTTIQYFIPSNKIGAKFSTVSYPDTYSMSPLMNNFAQVFSDSIITDTMNWTTIRGSFIADSSYKYIIIGNFFDDAHTDTIYSSTGVLSYFFIDDICVSIDSAYAYNYVWSGINEINNKEEIINIYPNPATDNITIGVSNMLNIPATIEISNIQGQIIKQQTTNVETTNINVSALAKGMYFVKVKTAKSVESKKFIKL